jgi:hypothetical protein
VSKRLVDRKPVAENQVDSPAAFVPTNNKIGAKRHAKQRDGRSYRGERLIDL